jgi:hypothetical protein
MNMNKGLIAAIATASSLMLGNAWAHGGAQPQHGGIVQVSSDMAFELVRTTDGVALYLDDHGKPFATDGVSGKLTVLTGSEKSEAPLTPAGGNKLEAKGVKLAAGSKAVAVVTLSDKKTVTVRYTVK